MSKKLLLSLTIMAGVLFVGVSPALASRLNCSTGQNARGYAAGVTVGKSIVRTAWASSDQSPDGYEAFRQLIRRTVRNAIANLPDDASNYTKCRAKGLSQGVCDGLGIVQDGIAEACFLDGSTWGALSGDIYCALAIEFGGADLFDLLPVAPTNLCGTNFVNGCTEGFEDYAYALEACELYTDEAQDDGSDPAFVNSYLSWQGGMCSYEIP
jgi:hypothetical protein